MSDACAVGGLWRKLSGGPGAYEGLWELLGQTYRSLKEKAPLPIDEQFVRDVNRLVGDLTREVSAMKVLVTGANGFLGQRVVAELLWRGHEVRAIIRPATEASKLRWIERVEVFRADLRVESDLGPAFEGVDALVHLAATVKGDAETQLSDAVVGTTRLLRAMANSKTRRVIFCSSFSVYDFDGARGRLTEETPIDPRIYERDGYAVAKYWQERVVRQACEEHGWELTVLRPGFIWGEGNEYLACLGQSFGRMHLVFGPMTRLPLTHVNNCSHYFVRAIENPACIGKTINIVDSDEVRAWRYMGLDQRGANVGGWRVPVPYLLCLLTVKTAYRVSKIIFRGKGKLPSLLVPCRFKARFKPLRYPNAVLQELLDTAPRSFDQCVDSTWSSPQAEPTPEVAYAP